MVSFGDRATVLDTPVVADVTILCWRSIINAVRIGRDEHRCLLDQDGFIDTVLAVDESLNLST